MGAALAWDEVSVLEQAVVSWLEWVWALVLVRIVRSSCLPYSKSSSFGTRPRRSSHCQSTLPYARIDRLGRWWLSNYLYWDCISRRCSNSRCLSRPRRSSRSRVLTPPLKQRRHCPFHGSQETIAVDSVASTKASNENEDPNRCPADDSSVVATSGFAWL